MDTILKTWNENSYSIRTMFKNNLHRDIKTMENTNYMRWTIGQVIKTLNWKYAGLSYVIPLSQKSTNFDSLLKSKKGKKDHQVVFISLMEVLLLTANIRYHHSLTQPLLPLLNHKGIRMFCSVSRITLSDTFNYLLRPHSTK